MHLLTNWRILFVPTSCSAKTFRSSNKKSGEQVSKQYQLKKLSEATLGSGNLRAAVTLPEGEDVNEWIAVNSMSGMIARSILMGTPALCSVHRSLPPRSL